MLYRARLSLFNMATSPVLTRSSHFSPSESSSSNTEESSVYTSYGSDNSDVDEQNEAAASSHQVFHLIPRPEVRV